MSKLFKVSWTDIKSALVSGGVMALVIIIANVIETGDIFNLNWKELANIGVIAFLTSFVSVLKSLLTTSEGNFAGAIKIK